MKDYAREELIASWRLISDGTPSVNMTGSGCQTCFYWRDDRNCPDGACEVDRNQLWEPATDFLLEILDLEDYQ